MTYEEVVDKILNMRRFDSLSGVFVTEKMMNDLGMPQKGIKWIHVAGTNGKGSVSAFLCRIFREAGYKTGMFTSPHLVDFRERIRVDGEMISKEAAAELGSMLLRTDFGVQPKMFDYCLAMAVLYFRDRKCDVMVIETGLGGRLDSTNALGVPDVSVITRIGYDHMEILGQTLEQIASEKAGIIKKGTKLVAVQQEECIMQVLSQAAEEAGVTDIRIVSQDDVTKEGVTDGVLMFTFREYAHIKMCLLGLHQYENAALAILAAEAFLESENPSSARRAKQKEWICQGISRTSWAGRMQILQKKPFLMVDGAHNISGVQALHDSLKYLFPGEKFHFIMGVMADKDYEGMAGLLAPLALDFSTVTVGSARALEAEKLAFCIRQKGIAAHACSDIFACLKNLPDNEKTVAFGSLYFVGELYSSFSKKITE